MRDWEVQLPRFARLRDLEPKSVETGDIGGIKDETEKRDHGRFRGICTSDDENQGFLFGQVIRILIRLACGARFTLATWRTDRKSVV